MLNAYRPGQAVLISHSRHIQVGDVVIVFMKGKEVMKRITQMQDGQIYVEGDNPEKSTDSRHHGWINDRHVAGKVIWPKKKKQPISSK